MSPPGPPELPSRTPLPCDAAEAGRRLARLEARLKGIAAAKTAAAEACASQVLEAELAIRNSRGALEEELEAALERAADESLARERRVRDKSERRASAAEKAYSERRAALVAELEHDEKKSRQDLDKAKERIAEEQRRKADLASERLTRFAEEIASLRARAEGFLREIEGFAAGCGVALVHVDAPGEPAVEGDDLEGAAGDVGRALGEIEGAFGAVRDARWPAAARLVHVLLAHLFVIAGHGGGLTVMLRYGAGFGSFVGLLLSLFVSVGLVQLASSLVRRKLESVTGGLHAAAAAAAGRLESLSGVAKERLDPARSMEERIARTLVVDRITTERSEKKKAGGKKALADLDRRRARFRQRSASHRIRSLERVRRESAEAERRLREGHAAELAAREARHRGEAEEAERGRERKLAELGTEWGNAVDELRAFASGATSSCRARHAAWDDPAWREWRPPAGLPEDVLLGSLRVDLARLAPGTEEGFPVAGDPQVTLPAALSFPACGSLLLAADGDGRDRALEILRCTVLRMLASLPPGKARLTLVDPVGLGQSFSSLMQLADHDESLVGGRIWTETAHIERRLADLTEHIETVIQKYLRDRYATIEDYNREAGEMMEAYHFLVVADLPAGWSDLALERLASIVASGPRCGVHALTHHDTRHALPPAFDVARLARNGLVLRGGKDGFAGEGDGLRHAAFLAEAPPGAGLVTRLLERIGKEALEGKRVEVPFASVAPREEELWSLTTDTGIRVPIGRTGAERLQHFDLGRGTAQHALIGGKTGSGKSTLFHVIITNTALWFGPREIEFYLIDFKKGVEFKIFARGRLPHARVIAIESDREFGLSVLQRVNKELGRRGELFRARGVQDLAAYRRSGAAEHLPRAVLIVDEFQEFFTEDDAIARDAALFLDRFVRQGRAFGIHVVLGSQTLSGIYTLAKSTLGQMGVRIALQCNESDSHLILSEDNAAARLLARPGEAIYNEMSGLVEGNNPFQVVWLPDGVEVEHLDRIAERARRDGWRPETPAVIFEGNAPAELAANLELAEMLGRPFAPEDAGERAWLGEANSIKGPTEVHFPPLAGKNLLVVGQYRESAFAMICASLVGLAARHPPGTLRVIAMNAGGADEYADGFARLGKAIPHGIEVVEPRRIPEIIEELEAESNAQAEKGADAQAVYLVVFGLHRLRALRQDEDYMFSAAREEGPPTGERFAALLREGPERNIHSIVWCDSLGSLTRALSRKTMREFDLRVLFQMSAADSSELIDETSANNLGLHGALLSVESEGLLEKFRPYAMPAAGYWEDVGGMLRGRFAV